MSWKHEFSLALQEDFRKRKDLNPRFSIRQYSKEIGLSVGGTSELLRGKGQLTARRAFEVLDRLQLNQDELQKLRSMISPFDERATQIDFLNPSQVDLLKDWRNRALSNLIGLQRDWSDAQLAILAGHLKIEASEMRDRIESLRQQNLLPNPDKPFVSVGPSKWVQAQSPSTEEFQRHLFLEQGDQMAKAARAVQVGSLSFLSAFFYCSPEERRMLQIEILRILHKIVFNSKDKSDPELFQISVQLLPVKLRTD